MQSGITIKDGNMVTGTLKYIEGGLSPAGPLAGSGNFLALKWADPATGITSLKVGLVPSASGMDLVECIDDTDRNGVFKITDKYKQKFVIQVSDGTHTNRQTYDLSQLVCENA